MSDIAPTPRRADIKQAPAATGKPTFVNDYNLARTALFDLDAAETLLRRVYPRIYEVVRSAVGYGQNPDDITQLAAIQVTKSLSRYQGRGSIEAWAAKIAYRKAMRTVKRQWKLTIATAPFTDEDFSDASCPTPEKNFSRRQLFDSLLSKMTEIPQKRRIPLVLHLVHGYTIKEVAELTDVPLNTVKDRLKTAFREFQALKEANPELINALVEELQ